MGAGWSIQYQVEHIIRVANLTAQNASESGSGESGGAWVLKAHNHTLYYCGLWTWSSTPCEEELIDELWGMIIGSTVLVLFVLISIWACHPQVVRVEIDTTYSPIAVLPCMNPTDNTQHLPQLYTTNLFSTQHCIAQSPSLEIKPDQIGMGASLSSSADRGSTTFRCSFAKLVL